VTGAQRNRGIGTALLAHAETWARAHGKRGLSLHVAAGNPAQHLYERLGFQLKQRIELRLERRLFDVEAWLYMVKAFPEGVDEAAGKG
jgi:ribosomal protein S18 acetylase RimI-like enzyme